MSSNSILGAADIVYALGWLLVALPLLWIVRDRIFSAPVSGLVAFAGALVGLVVTLFQWAFFRLTDYGGTFGPYGTGTVILRAISVALLLYFVSRLYRRSLITDDDRETLDKIRGDG